MSTQHPASSTSGHLDFVLRYYQPDRLDTQQALRRIAPAPTVPLWRRWAAAASVGALLLAGAYAAWRTIGTTSGDTTSPADSMQVGSAGQPALHHFHFEDTPLPDVLSELSRYYGVTLTVSDSDKHLTTPDSEKHLTADFDSETLDETIGMIEQVLGISINVGK